MSASYSKILSGAEYRIIYGTSATFDGFAVADSDVLIKYTYNGDTDFNGKVDARYFFKDGQVAGQEQVAEAEPSTPVLPFGSVQDELTSMTAPISPRERAGQRVATKATGGKK